MNTLKKLKFTTLAALVLTLLFVSPVAKAAGGAPVVLNYAKWVIPGGHMDGIVDGGVFQGQVLNLTQISGGQIWKIDAQYEIIAGDQSFVAVIHGTHSWYTGVGTLNGVITDGWNVGARVHVKFVAIPSAEHGVVFQGTITIMPN